MVSPNIVIDKPYFHVVGITSGCIIREPSVVLDPSDRAGTELSLWAVTNINEGDTVGEQGYWGRLVTRKPRGDTRTVQLALDVKVKDDVKSLLLVGDERCCLAYANDPSVGAAKKKKIKANVKIVHAEGGWEVLLTGMMYAVVVVCNQY